MKAVCRLSPEAIPLQTTFEKKQAGEVSQKKYIRTGPRKDDLGLATQPALSEKKFEKMPPKKNFYTFYLLYNLKEEKMASASDFHFMLIKSESDTDAICITLQ